MPLFEEELDIVDALLRLATERLRLDDGRSGVVIYRVNCRGRVVSRYGPSGPHFERRLEGFSRPLTLRAPNLTSSKWVNLSSEKSSAYLWPSRK